MLGKETRIVSKIRNLEINYEAINVCQREIALGNQVRNAHNEYALGNYLYASQDVGKKRTNQEDSVLILEHEENPKFKIMAVADGMGGHEYGEVASTHALERLSNWFNSLSPDFYEYPEQLQLLLNEELKTISNEIYHRLGSNKYELVGGTTFTGAIVCKDKTIVSSVGDSRAYAVKGFDVRLVTKDESQVWKELTQMKNTDDLNADDVDSLRFASGNNVITRCLGQKDLNNIQSYLIDNKTYDIMLLFTDGITDILSSRDIQLICATTTPEELAEVFVNYALTHNVTEQLRGMNHEVEIISAGKDNASAAAYVRR